MSKINSDSMMSKEELLDAARKVAGAEIEDLALDELRRLMTVTQYLTDVCLNEIERRDELTYLNGIMIVPYMCDHDVETVLTR